VEGVGLGAGVLVASFDDVTVASGTLRDFDHGVVVTGGAVGTELSGLSLELNQEAGVLLSGAARGIEVHGSSFSDNGLAIGVIEGPRER
jgi:hypothetical protein